MSRKTENGFSKRLGQIRGDQADGFTYLDRAQFHDLFAADLPAAQANFMAHSQALNFAPDFHAVYISHPEEVAAWIEEAAGARK